MISIGPQLVSLKSLKNILKRYYSGYKYYNNYCIFILILH